MLASDESTLIEGFTASLERDLQQIGYRLERALKGNSKGFLIPVGPADPVAPTRLRDTQRGAEKASDDLQIVGQVAPIVAECRSPSERDQFEQFRTGLSVVANTRIGRYQRFLVKDSGAAGSPVCGAFALASSPYQVKDRDDYLRSLFDPRMVHRDLISHIMDLSICTSSNAYSCVRGTKLMATLALCKETLDAFSNKYGTELWAVIATCASGAHCPIYNRIMITEGGLYRRVGLTAGLSFSHISETTFRFARALAGSESGGNWSIREPSARPSRVLRRALTLSRISKQVVNLGTRKGIYVALTGLAPIDHATSKLSSRSFTQSEAATFWEKSIRKRVG